MPDNVAIFGKSIILLFFDKFMLAINIYILWCNCELKITVYYSNYLTIIMAYSEFLLSRHYEITSHKNMQHGGGTLRSGYQFYQQPINRNLSLSRFLISLGRE